MGPQEVVQLPLFINPGYPELAEQAQALDRESLLFSSQGEGEVLTPLELAILGAVDREAGR